MDAQRVGWVHGGWGGCTVGARWVGWAHGGCMVGGMDAQRVGWMHGGWGGRMVGAQQVGWMHSGWGGCTVGARLARGAARSARRMTRYAALSRDDVPDNLAMMFITFPAAKDPTYEQRHPGTEWGGEGSPACPPPPLQP